MNNTSIEITNKLPQEMVEIYSDIAAHTNALDINYLVVGAMARDLVLVHCYGAKVERATRDIDIGINVASWADINALKKRLLAAGYKADSNKWHRLTCQDSAGQPWEIDILPFGDIAAQDATISWPPKQETVMTVWGFSEAVEHALAVQISNDPKIIIPVASPAGGCILKLVSWLDRESDLKAKDASDFEYLIRSYTKIPEIHEAIYQEGLVEKQEWDESKASAMKLGQDAGAIALPGTQAYLQRQFFDQPARKEQFARDMQKNSHSSQHECAEQLAVFAKAFMHMATQPLAEPRKQEFRP